MIRTSYDLLGYLSFFTVGEDECRAWSIARGTTAQAAAGEIHTDIQRGFIRAEVVAYDALTKRASMAACRDHGEVRLEGKEHSFRTGTSSTSVLRRERESAMAEAGQADSSLSAKPCPCYGLEPLMPDRPESRAPGLTMFFPAHNDAGTIASLVIQAQEAIRQLTPDFEIIVVNDGSRDQTGQIAEELAPNLSQRAGDPPHRQSRLWWRAAIRVRRGDQGTDRVPTATPNTIRPRSRRCGRDFETMRIW